MEGLNMSIWTLALLIAIALAFDFMNGFHDGANSISTIVATGALTPKQAVLFAAFFNFAALWVFQLKVAATIGKGTVDPTFVDYYVIFGALMGALIWNIITWYYGIPSSSSHALVGGLVGATVAKAGSGAPIVWEGFGKILAFIIISPLVGVIIGGLLMVLVAWIFRGTSPYQAGKFFKGGQLFAAAAYSLGHGGNDAQRRSASSGC
jgi:PiT family inorganic phosphate transporter